VTPVSAGSRAQRTTKGCARPCTTMVRTTTPVATRTNTSRDGNGAPPATVVGTASAAAIVTAPRKPKVCEAAEVDHTDIDDPRTLRRADFPVLRDLPTRWSDDDVYGHVNNVIHYLMFDTAVNGWLIEASGTDIRRLPAIGVVVETSCRYFSELRFPEVATAGIGLERLGTSSVVYRLALFSQRAEQPAAVGRFVHVYVDAGARTPVAVPPEIRAALRLLEGRS
jgi:acyl-CoA thioester hydrolase